MAGPLLDRRQFALGGVGAALALSRPARALAARPGLDSFRQRARELGARALIVMRGEQTLGVDDYAPLSAIEKSATIRQLLQARSGIYIPASPETSAMRAARPARGSHAPGTFWYYNNWDFNVLGDIYQRVTGEGLFTATEHRLARPLGWRDFDALRHIQWGYEPASPRFGAYNMWMSARDMVTLGQLLLDAVG